MSSVMTRVPSSEGSAPANADKNCPLSRDLPWYESESSHISYRESAERVRPGNGLIVVAWNAKGYRLGEILYRLLDTMSHKTGLVVEVMRLTSSVQMRVRHANINSSKECLLHLCKRSPCGFIGRDDGTVAHVTEWKAFAPTAVSEPWVDPETIQQLMEPHIGRKSALLQELAVNAYSSSDYASELTALQPELQRRSHDKGDTRSPKTQGQPKKKAWRKWFAINQWRKYLKSQGQSRRARKGEAKGKGKG